MTQILVGKVYVEDPVETHLMQHERLTVTAPGEKRIWVQPYLRGDGTRVVGYWRDLVEGVPDLGPLVRPQAVEDALERRRNPGYGPNDTRWHKTVGTYTPIRPSQIEGGFRYLFPEHSISEYSQEPKRMFLDDGDFEHLDDGSVKITKGKEPWIVSPNEIVERFDAQNGWADYLDWNARRFGFSSVEGYDAWTQRELERLTSQENGQRVNVRTSPEALLSMLKSGRWLNIHEEGAHSPAGLSLRADEELGETIAKLSKGRADFEPLVWNIDPDSPRSNWPIYAYVATDKEYVAENVTAAFGDIKLVLKDSVRPRTTIAYGDTNGLISGTAGTDRNPLVPSPIDAPSYLSVPPLMDLRGIETSSDEFSPRRPPRLTNEQRDAIIDRLGGATPRAASKDALHGLSDGQLWEYVDKWRYNYDTDNGHERYLADQARHIGTQIEEDLYKAGWSPWRHGTYIEAHVLGGLTTEDIERVEFPEEPSEEIENTLMRLGIPWRVYPPKLSEDMRGKEKYWPLEEPVEDVAAKLDAFTPTFRRTKTGDALLERLIRNDSPESVKDLWEEDPQDAIASSLDLNNAPSMATIERARDAARELTYEWLKKKYPDGWVMLFRGGERPVEVGLIPWTPNRETALFFARGDESQIRQRMTSIHEIVVAIQAMPSGKYSGFRGEEEYLLWHDLDLGEKAVAVDAYRRADGTYVAAHVRADREHMFGIDFDPDEVDPEEGSAAWHYQRMPYNDEVDYRMQYAEQVPTEVAASFMEYDRVADQQNQRPERVQYLSALARHIKDRGMGFPIFLDYNEETGMGHISEGHHRIEIARYLGMPSVPVLVYQSRRTGHQNQPMGPFTGEYENQHSIERHGATPRMPEYGKPSDFGIETYEETKEPHLEYDKQLKGFWTDDDEFVFEPDNAWYLRPHQNGVIPGETEGGIAWKALRVVRHKWDEDNKPLKPDIEWKIWVLNEEGRPHHEDVAPRYNADLTGGKFTGIGANVGLDPDNRARNPDLGMLIARHASRLRKLGAQHRKGVKRIWIEPHWRDGGRVSGHWRDAFEGLSNLGDKWKRVGPNEFGNGTIWESGEYQITSKKLGPGPKTYPTVYRVSLFGLPVGNASSRAKAEEMARMHDAGELPPPEHILNLLRSGAYHHHEAFGGDPLAMSDDQYARSVENLKLITELFEDGDNRDGRGNMLYEILRHANQSRARRENE